MVSPLLIRERIRLQQLNTQGDPVSSSSDAVPFLRGDTLDPGLRREDEERSKGRFVIIAAQLQEGTPVAMKRMVVEIGMGTDIRGADYTKAAVRALRDALWHNSLNIAAALGMSADAMVVEVLIGVPKPERVDKGEVLAVLPHGTGTVKVVEGGLEIVNDEGTGSTVIANAAAIVHLDV